ncbi:pyridoxamine 5'-phosphate oxidase family protein [Nocardia sp. bgisy134]|uniref:pyridoxamine 5'-phosphate oxidase family protein n=1 Tax=Nocardia sp. bgisy134 TaxID=3413789 RepID=UPI003D73C82C
MGGTHHYSVQVTRHKPLSASAETFLAEPLSATLTTIRPDGSLHAAPVRFTWDGEAGLARVMTVGSSRKARNLAANPGSRVALCQVDGFRWITLEGTATVSNDSREVSDGVSRYTRRYQSPPPNPPERVVITIAVDSVMTLNT